MHNRTAMLLILLLTDPNLMEAPQTRQDTTTQPRRMSPLCRVPRSMNLNPLRRLPDSQLVRQAVYKARKERGSAYADDVGEEGGAGVYVY